MPHSQPPLQLLAGREEKRAREVLDFSSKPTASSSFMYTKGVRSGAPLYLMDRSPSSCQQKHWKALWAGTLQHGTQIGGGHLYPQAQPTPSCHSAHPPPAPSHSLQDIPLLQVVFPSVLHGSIVHSLDGTVDGLEDHILLQHLRNATSHMSAHCFSCDLNLCTAGAYSRTDGSATQLLLLLLFSPPCRHRATNVTALKSGALQSHFTPCLHFCSFSSCCLFCNLVAFPNPHTQTVIATLNPPASQLG